MSRNKHTTRVIDSLLLLYELLTAYRIPRRQLLKKPRHLEFIFSAYRVPRSQLHKIHRHLEFIFSAYRVPRSQLNKIPRHLEFIFSAYRVPRSQWSDSWNQVCSSNKLINPLVRGTLDLFWLYWQMKLTSNASRAAYVPNLRMLDG